MVPLHQKNPWILTLQTFSALSCTSLYSAEVRSLVVSRVQGTKSDHLKHTVRLLDFLFLLHANTISELAVFVAATAEQDLMPIHIPWEKMEA